MCSRLSTAKTKVILMPSGMHNLNQVFFLNCFVYLRADTFRWVGGLINIKGDLGWIWALNLQSYAIMSVFINCRK